MTATRMTIAELCISPFNVRRRVHDEAAIAELARSLVSSGQLHALTAHPMPDGKGKAGALYGVVAGNGRRLAFLSLIENGELPRDHPIDVNVHEGLSEGELLELSMAEGIHRELRPYELYAGASRAYQSGRTYAQIAQANGQEIETVKQWCRLGALEPSIFAALEAGEISEGQARAFGSVEDHKLQLWAFEQVQASSMNSQRGADAIRRLLKVGDREQRKLLLFVGEEAYRNAGGRYDLDLFADTAEERGRVSDEGLLLELAEAMLEARRVELRERAGRDVRFERDYPKNGDYGGVANDLEIADADIDEILHAPKADIFATVLVDHEGHLEERWWWASRKALRAYQKASDATSPTPTPVSAGPIGKGTAPVATEKVLGGRALDGSYSYGDRTAANATIKLEQGLTTEGVDALREIRREVLRAGLVGEAQAGGDLGADFVIWCLARFELIGGYAHEFGARQLASSSDSILHGAGALAKRTEAHRKWDGIVAYVESHPSMVEKDLVLAFRHYRGDKKVFRNVVAALVAGMMLNRSANADGYRVPLHDLLGQSCGLAHDDVVRQLVEPTEEMVALMPNAHRLAQAQPHIDGATRRALQTAKAKDTIGPVTRALRGAKAWIHPMLKFTPPAPPGEAGPS